MSYRILYIAPHLSTGGCPQYLLKKLQLLNGDNEIYCVEYHDYGEWFTVQKNQVRTLLGDRYFALKDDKREIVSIIEKVNPDIVHIEEMPEYFMADDIADMIYKSDRSYNIVETSHDSSFNPATKRHFPDQFVFVSEYQKRNVESLNIPSTVVEYPIPFKMRTDRSESLKSLGLDPSLFHVVNVGLFSPRKNQSEIIEYARKMTHLPIQFHFVGNLAGNFQSYWEPLLKDVPPNCKIWGERSDVDNFMGCMDLFLFTSRGHAHDKETSPIVIREAISYKIPSLIYNLPVYLGMYDRYSNIKYLTEDMDKNIQLITERIANVPVSDKSFVYVVSSYPYTDVMEKTTVNCLRSLKNSKTILTTHHKNYNRFNNVAAQVLFDESNPIIKHTFYKRYWMTYPEFAASINLDNSNNDDYHGLAVWTNYQNGVRKSKELGYKYSVCLNYDLVLNESDLTVVENIIKDLESSSKKGFFIYEKAQEGDTLKTVFFVINNDYFLEKFKKVTTPEEYFEDLKSCNSPSNGLENYVYNVLKNNLSDLITTADNEKSLFPNSELNLFSCVEYFSVLPVENENKFVVWKNSEGVVDNKTVVVNIKENGDLTSKLGFHQSSKSHVYSVFDLKPNTTYTVICDEYNADLEKINTKTSVFGSLNDIKSYGSFSVGDLRVNSNYIKGSKIHIHHFSNDNTSIDSVSSIPDIVYHQYFNETDLDILFNLRYYPNDTHIVLKNVEIKNDAMKFLSTVKEARDYMYDNNLVIYSFGSCFDGAFFGVSKHYTGYKLAGTDAYIINNNYIQSLSEVKVNDSLALFNSYLSQVKKGFSSSSEIILL